MLVIDHHTIYMWVRFLMSKDDTCPQVESIMLEICHVHARHHSCSNAHILKFDSDSVFEAAAARLICGRFGVGVYYSAPYAHHMLGKAKRPWRTLRDNASALLHGMSVPNSTRSCAINTVVYLRNRTLSRTVCVSRGVSLTSQKPDASKFRVFGCAVSAKLPDKLRRKLGEKAFRGIMVGYPRDSPAYCIYNPAIRRINTPVHVVFQEDVQGFPPSLTVDSLIFYEPDTDTDPVSGPHSHPLDLDQRSAYEELDLDPRAAAEAPPLPDLDRLNRLRSHPIRYGELVAPLSDHPHVFVATWCDPERGKATEDIVAQPDMATLITGHSHLSAGATTNDISLLSA
jgi:hypothetical protein